MPMFCDLTTVDFRHFAKVIVRRKKSHSSALRILSALFPTAAKKKIAPGESTKQASGKSIFY